VIFFSKVEQSFTVRGRGTFIVPAPPSDLDFRLHKRDVIQLRNHSGEIVDTSIVGIELVKPVSRPCRMASQLPKEIEKSAIEPETEIWVKNAKFGN
jgi:hypothetical protein